MQSGGFEGLHQDRPYREQSEQPKARRPGTKCATTVRIEPRAEKSSIGPVSPLKEIRGLRGRWCKRNGRDASNGAPTATLWIDLTELSLLPQGRNLHKPCHDKTWRPAEIDLIR